MNQMFPLSSHEIFTYHPYRAPDRLRNGSIPEDAPAVSSSDTSDSVEFSNSALAISRERALEFAATRADRLLRIKSEIENNTYETPEKIRATAGRLVEILDLG